MTRSKELRRIEQAIEHRHKEELRWALAQCELRKQLRSEHSHLWHRIEKRVREALAEIANDPN
jgi:hypothetical protein